MIRAIFVGFLLCLYSSLALGSKTSKPGTSPPNTRKQSPLSKSSLIPITILFTSDLGGRLQGFRCRKKKEAPIKNRYDVAELLGQVTRVRQQLQRTHQPAPLLFSTGDNLAPRQDTRFLLQTRAFNGAEHLAKMFKRFRYDLIGIGNHELSIPLHQLDLFLQHSRSQGISFAASNITNVAQAHPFHNVINRDVQQRHKPYFLFKRRHNTKTIKIAVFHLIPQKMSVIPKRVEGLSIAPPIQHAKALVQLIKTQVPDIGLIVALSHLGQNNHKNSLVKRLAQEVPGLHLIVSNGLQDSKAHARMLKYTNRKGQHVYLVGGSKYGKMLHQVQLQLDIQKPLTSRVAYFNSTTIQLQSKVYDRPLRARLQRWRKKYCDAWGKQLGKGIIPKGKRMKYKHFIRYLLNLMRQHTKTEMAVINTGAVRQAPFPLREYVTRDDLYRTLPFNEKLIRVRVTGEQFLRWFKPPPGDPLASKEEMEFAGWDEKKTINGRPIQVNQWYEFITIEYVVSQRRRSLLQLIESSKEKVKKLKHQLHQMSLSSSQKGVKKKPSLSTRQKLQQRISAAKQATRKARKQLLKFDKSWSVIVRPVCPQVRSLSSVCSEQCCPHIRTVVQDHFQQNNFTAPSSTLSVTGKVIPYKGKWLDLYDEVVWQFNMEINIAFDANFINPTDLVSARSYSRIPIDFFNQSQFSGNMKFELQGSTRNHQWSSVFQLQYGAYARSQSLPKDGSLVTQNIFDEVSDLILFGTQYQYSPVPRFSPFLRFEVQTEFTPRGRPDLDNQSYIKTLNQVRYRHFAVEGEFGFAFGLIPKYLQLNVAFNARQQLALHLFPDNEAMKEPLYQNVRGRPDTNFLPGLSIRYETPKIHLFSIVRRKITFQSMGRYVLRASVAFDLAEQDTLLTHDLELDNILAFSVTAQLSLIIRLRAIFYQGTLQKDGPDTRLRITGPWAFWLTPSAMLQFQWGTRKQSF